MNEQWCIVKIVCGTLGQTAPIINAILFYNIGGTFGLCTYSPVLGPKLLALLYEIVYCITIHYDRYYSMVYRKNCVWYFRADRAY